MHLLQTELVLSIEEIFPKRIRRHFIIRKQTVYPNQPGRLEKFFAFVRSDNSKAGGIIVHPLNLPTVCMHALIFMTLWYLHIPCSRIEATNPGYSSFKPMVIYTLSQHSSQQNITAELTKGLASLSS